MGLPEETPHSPGVGMDEAAYLAAWDARYGGAPDYPAVRAYAASVIAHAATAPDDPWRTLATHDIAALFGRFHVGADIGEQTGHASVLTQWRGRQPDLAGVSPRGSVQ